MNTWCAGSARGEPTCGPEVRRAHPAPPQQVHRQTVLRPSVVAAGRVLEPAAWDRKATGTSAAGSEKSTKTCRLSGILGDA